MLLVKGNLHIGYTITEVSPYDCIKALHTRSNKKYSECEKIFDYLKLNERFIYTHDTFGILCNKSISITENTTEDFIEKLLSFKDSFYIVIRCTIKDNYYNLTLVDIVDTNLADIKCIAFRKVILNELIKEI